MEWIDYVAKGIGALVALGTLLKVGSELYTKFKNGSEFGMWFGRRRKVRGLKYVSIFQKRGALSSRNEISNVVKQQLTREAAKDVVHSYSIERRSHRLSRNTRDFVSLVVTILVFAVLLIAIGVLPNSESVSSVQQPIVSFVAIILYLYIVTILAMFLLQVIIALGRAFDEFRSMAEASRLDVVQVPLESIPHCVEREKDYCFVDATIRKFHQVPFLGTADCVHMLLDQGAITNEIVFLKKSEAKQIKADNYEEVAAQLVDSFLAKTLEHGSEPVCFVFSQAGITAVLVTQLLRSKGLRAFYIGATNGYESEVREAIREIRILRESGLI